MGNVANLPDIGNCQGNTKEEPQYEKPDNQRTDSICEAGVVTAEYPQEPKEAVPNSRQSDTRTSKCVVGK